MITSESTEGASPEPRHSTAHPSPLDLAQFLPFASAQLQAPYRVLVVTQIQEEYISKVVEEKGKKKNKSAITQHTTTHMRPESGQGARSDASGSRQHLGSAHRGGDELIITAVQDHALKLVELSFKRWPQVPRLLMQIIALCVPYHPYLTKLNICRARLRGDALYEIAKFLPASQLTDVCLDDSPVAAKNYYLLLDHAQLQCLSLARCKLDDEDCAALAAKLVHPLPASRTLRVLSLVSNAISDAGACALARALRSNRALQHLNLSGNRIADAGACALLRTATEFHLTFEELTTKRQRFINFLILRKEVFARCLAELMAACTDSRADDAKGVAKKRSPAPRGRKQSALSMSVATGPGLSDPVGQRADFMTNDLIGIYTDPFGVEETVSRDGSINSLGNTSLCYLSLAYNGLGYASLVTLCDVLQYQSAMVHKAGPGLMRVVMDGNPLPETCFEYALINDLLERAITLKSSKQLKKLEKPKSRTVR